MEKAEKRLELLKLKVEKEGKCEDGDDDWDDSDDDFSDEDSSS